MSLVLRVQAAVHPPHPVVPRLDLLGEAVGGVLQRAHFGLELALLLREDHQSTRVFAYLVRGGRLPLGGGDQLALPLEPSDFGFLWVATNYQSRGESGLVSSNSSNLAFSMYYVYVVLALTSAVTSSISLLTRSISDSSGVVPSPAPVSSPFETPAECAIDEIKEIHEKI